MVIGFGTGLPKMSDTFVAFAEPLLAGVPETEDGWRAGLYTAAFVRNDVSRLAEAELTARLQRGFGAAGRSWTRSALAVANEMVKRHRAMFPVLHQ